MDVVITKYYEGFEGEPEIRFLKGLAENSKMVLCLWDGYFDDIMRQFSPSDFGWTGLAYQYHLGVGWEEGKLWEIPDLLEALNEFQTLDPQKLEFDSSQEVLSAICNLIRDAISHHEKVWIEKE